MCVELLLCHRNQVVLLSDQISFADVFFVCICVVLQGLGCVSVHVRLLVLVYSFCIIITTYCPHC